MAVSVSTVTSNITCFFTFHKPMSFACYAKTVSLYIIQVVITLPPYCFIGKTATRDMAALRSVCVCVCEGEEKDFIDFYIETKLLYCVCFF